MGAKRLQMRKLREILRLKYERRMGHRAIARACGYATVRRADSLPALPAAVQGVSGAGLGLLELRIATGARPDLPRPDVDPETRLAALRRTLAASPEPEP